MKQDILEKILLEKIEKFVRDTAEFPLFYSDKSIEEISISMNTLINSIHQIMFFEIFGEPEEFKGKNPQDIQDEYFDLLKAYIKSRDITKEILALSLSGELSELLKENRSEKSMDDFINLFKGKDIPEA